LHFIGPPGRWGVAGEPARREPCPVGGPHKGCVQMQGHDWQSRVTGRAFFGADWLCEALRRGETLSIVCACDGEPADGSLRWSSVGGTGPCVLFHPPKDKNLPSGRFSRRENIWSVASKEAVVRKKATRFRVAFFVSGPRARDTQPASSRSISSVQSWNDHTCGDSCSSPRYQATCQPAPRPPATSDVSESPT